jgi:hypothetical protein
LDWISYILIYIFCIILAICRLLQLSFYHLFSILPLFGHLLIFFGFFILIQIRLIPYSGINRFRFWISFDLLLFRIFWHHFWVLDILLNRLNWLIIFCYTLILLNSFLIWDVLLRRGMTLCLIFILVKDANLLLIMMFLIKAGIRINYCLSCFSIIRIYLAFQRLILIWLVINCFRIFWHHFWVLDILLNRLNWLIIFCYTLILLNSFLRVIWDVLLRRGMTLCLIFILVKGVNLCIMMFLIKAGIRINYFLSCFSVIRIYLAFQRLILIWLVINCYVLLFFWLYWVIWFDIFLTWWHLFLLWRLLA